VKNRIVLIGAGSAMFGLETLGDIFRSKDLAGSEVVLHDINPESLRQVEGMARQYIQEHGLPYTLFATTSRREALQGRSPIKTRVRTPTQMFARERPSFSQACPNGGCSGSC